MWSSLRLTILMLLLTASLWGCKTEDILPLSTINQVEVDGAILPLHIYGSVERSTMVLVINGGPGQSAILERRSTGFSKLESVHRVAYLDQRGCGISGGNVDPNSMTVDQWAEDIGRVVELIAASNEVQSLFILGMDWGCPAIASYLASSQANDIVKGFIAVAPGFDAANSMAQSRADILEEAQSLLDDNDQSNDEAAQNVITYYDQNPVINMFNYEEHVRLLDAIGGIVLNTAAETSGVSFPDYSPSLLEKNEIFALENFSSSEGHFLKSLDVTSDLSRIAVPVKMIWGAFDRLMPLSVADNYESALGVGSEDERISVFPASAHRPYLEEGDRFFATVNAWVSFYN